MASVGRKLVRTTLKCSWSAWSTIPQPIIWEMAPSQSQSSDLRLTQVTEAQADLQ